MIKKLMRKYALSRTGAKDFIKSTIICTLSDLVLMLPVNLLFFLIKDLLEGGISKTHYYFYIIGIVVILILMYIINFFKYNSTFFTTYKESGIRRISLAERLRKLPLSFFGKKDVTDLTTVMLGDATTLEHNFSHVMPQFYSSLISTFIIAISLFFFNWKMAIASLWVYPVALIIVGTSEKIQNIFNRKKNEAILDCSNGIQEAIENLKELKSNNAEDEYLDELNKKFSNLEHKQIGAELGTAIFVMTSTLILKLGIATTALVGARLLIGNEIDILTFFLFLLVVSRIYEPMGGALINLAAINSQKISIERMNEFNDYKEQTGSELKKLDDYNIEFNNVSFSYDNSDIVLNKVSFIAEQGKVTALIGSSGCGKSTVSKLSARFWDINDGLITLGGQDISKIDPENLLKNYSIVFQDVTLFNNTVMENIRIGKSGATDDEVLKAAHEANCDIFVNKLSDGYNTMIGENGYKLSGGERQRISIARAILKDAPVILLDEATASLDAENETEIQEALSKLIKDKTVLMIAHRMRTVTNADKIVVLKDGVVAEQGTPKELLKKKGLFANMVETQIKSFNWNIK